MTISDFEQVFDHIGGFGPYQWIIFGIVCIFNCFFTSIYYGQIFMVLTPPHWCKLPSSLELALVDQLGPNVTVEQLKNFTIPPLPGGGYEQCKRYDFQIQELTTINLSSGSSMNLSTVDCDHGWEYDYSYYYPTITSQLNWVCSDDWKPPLAQSLFFVGSVIGVPLFGWLADHFGRIPILVISNCIGGVFGVASAFSNSFVVFCVLRFFVGMSFDSHFLIIYTLGLEFVSASYRSIVTNVPMILFLSVFKAFLPWVAFYLHNWTIFAVVIYAPILLVLGVPFLMPESARWLIGKGKTEEVVVIIKKAAKFNGKELSQQFISDFRRYVTNEQVHRPSKVITWYDLLKTPTLRKRFIVLGFMWLATLLVFDGLIRNSENIGFNFFVTFSILAAIEIPAGIIAQLSIEWIGRKNTIMVTIISSGIISVATIGVDPAKVETILSLGIASRFLITMAINVSVLYILEVLPTVGRAQGSAAIHAVGFLTIFFSPYIVYLSKIQLWIPYAVLGTMSLIGGLSTLLLPETLRENLPDTLEDGENFFTEQPIIYNPFVKRRNKHLEKKGKETSNFATDTKI